MVFDGLYYYSFQCCVYSSSAVNNCFHTSAHISYTQTRESWQNNHFRILEQLDVFVFLLLRTPISHCIVCWTLNRIFSSCIAYVQSGYPWVPTPVPSTPFHSLVLLSTTPRLLYRLNMHIRPLHCSSVEKSFR